MTPVYQLMLPRGMSALHVKEVNVLRGDPGLPADAAQRLKVTSYDVTPLMSKSAARRLLQK